MAAGRLSQLARGAEDQVADCWGHLTGMLHVSEYVLFQGLPESFRSRRVPVCIFGRGAYTG